MVAKVDEKKASCFILGNQATLHKLLAYNSNALLDASLVAANMNLWALGRFVRRADACKVGNFTGASLFVQTLWVSLLCLFDRDVDIDFEKGQWVGVLVGLCV